MNERKQAYISVLREKSDIMLNLLEATTILEFSGEGDEEAVLQEAEVFSALYERRADIFSAIEKIDESLAEFIDLEEDLALAKTTKPIIDGIKETAKTLIELDKKNIQASEKIMTFLRNNLKKMRDSRGASNAYSAPTGSTGYHFDSAK